MRVGSSVLTSLFVMSLAFNSPFVYGQAWVPEEGQVSASLYYERGDVNHHLFSGDLIVGGVNYGKRVDFGHIRAQSMHLSIDYGISNRLALSTSVPATLSRYEGTLPENIATDDGQFRGGFQDFKVEVRYMTLEEPIVITPFLSLTLPSHDYETFGHVALGRRLRELHVGFYMGKLLTFISDDLVAEWGYDFGYSEEVENTRPNRSRFDFGLGYFVTPIVTINSYAAFVTTHAGMDWLDEMDEHSFTDHDRMARATFLQIGGLVSVDLSDAARIFVGYSSIIWGKNTHAIQSIAIGSAWTLQLIE